MRLGCERCTSEDRKAFEAWRSLSPTHQVAFESASSAWEDLAFADPADIASRPAKVEVDRRMLLASGAAALGVGGGMFAWTAASARTLETGIGQRRSAELKPGVSVEMDALSRLRIDNGGGRAHLLQGRCHFVVQNQPFVARAGPCDLIVEQAIFEVECADGALRRLTLLEGHGILKGLRRGRMRLDAPRILDGQTMAVGVPDTELLESLTLWRSGRVMFHDSTLAEALAIMNRYDIRPLRVTQPQVANLKVSGMFQVGDNARFADTLAAILPITVQAADDELRLSAQAPATARDQETFTNLP